MAVSRLSSQRPREQIGFTLVEIALVLVVIGLLIGGILKGMQLISSSRVRSLADSAEATQAAYFGFMDRYRRVPGDWNASAATAAIGVTINGGGNDSGRIDNPGGLFLWREPNALWEQLSKAEFITGEYAGGFAAPTPDNSLAPVNVFGQVMVVGRTSDYEGGAQVKLNFVMGRGIPVGAARELDAKIDDGVANTGRVRATLDDGSVTTFAGPGFWGGRDAGCVAGGDWNVGGDAQDCNALMLF